MSETRDTARPAYRDDCRVAPSGSPVSLCDFSPAVAPAPRPPLSLVPTADTSRPHDVGAAVSSGSATSRRGIGARHRADTGGHGFPAGSPRRNAHGQLRAHDHWQIRLPYLGMGDLVLPRCLCQRASDTSTGGQSLRVQRRRTVRGRTVYLDRRRSRRPALWRCLLRPSHPHARRLLMGCSNAGWGVGLFVRFGLWWLTGGNLHLPFLAGAYVGHSLRPPAVIEVTPVVGTPAVDAPVYQRR